MVLIGNAAQGADIMSIDEVSALFDSTIQRDKTDRDSLNSDFVSVSCDLKTAYNKTAK